MATTWRSYGDHMAIAWRSYGDHMAITWRSHGRRCTLLSSVSRRSRPSRPGSTHLSARRCAGPSHSNA
eukprot:2276877-Prymnesium_polylepis.1